MSMSMVLWLQTKDFWYIQILFVFLQETSEIRFEHRLAIGCRTVSPQKGDPQVFEQLGGCSSREPDEPVRAEALNG